MGNCRYGFTGVVLFAVFTLLPFLLHTYGTLSPVFTGRITPLQSCIDAPGVTSLRECVITSAPESSQAIGAIGVITFILLGLLTLWWIPARMSFSKIRSFIILRLTVTLIAIAGIPTAYVLIRNESQHNTARVTFTAYAEAKYGLGLQEYTDGRTSALARTPEALCAQANAILSCKNSIPTTTELLQQNGKTQPLTVALLGYGNLLEYVIIVSALYLIAPLLNWYQFVLNPRRIRGQRKEAVFQ